MSAGSRTVALIQARMSSSRLPGKVLLPLQGLPMIVYMARRAARAGRVDQVVVVTSTDPSDTPLAEALAAAGIAHFRGSLDDVLARYAAAAEAFAAEVVVRLTGDCPLIDPAVIDAVVALRAASGADYASNVDPPTFPDGLDVECFTRRALERTHAEARRGSEREHVTSWMRTGASGLVRTNHRAVADFSSLRWTVDHRDDYEAVGALLQAHHRLQGDTAAPDLFDLLRALDRQRSLADTRHHVRNEGLARSLALDLPENGAPT